MLRVAGRRFAVDRYFQRPSALQPIKVYRRGDPVFPASQPRGRRQKQSGASFTVSRRDFTQFAWQVRDAIRYLERHRSELKTLCRFAGVDVAFLDFAVEPGEHIMVQSWRFPAPLVALAQMIPLELELSIYLSNGFEPSPSRRVR
jgi:hypothetical protein